MGMYRETGGGDGHEIKCNSDREFTNAGLQKTVGTGGNIFWRKKVLVHHVCFRLGFLALAHCIVNEALKKEVLRVAS